MRRDSLLRILMAAFAASLAAGCGGTSAGFTSADRADAEPAAARNATGASAGRPSGQPRNMLSRQSALALEKADRDPYWLRARETVDTTVESLIAQHQEELARGLKVNKLLRGDPKRKWVALTFDDGPHPAYTPQILAALREAKVPATFFLVGQMAEKYPDLVRAEVADGHSIANHTYHHVSLPKIPAEFVATEIQACGDILERISGQPCRLFRPPGGQYNPAIAEAVEALGYRLILWTDDPGDYASPGETVIAARLLRDLDNGGIILIHDGIRQTLDLLLPLIREIKAQGYEFVTVDEMLRAQTGEEK